MISIEGLTYRINGRTLLDKVSASIPYGKKVGLIGPNGAGKSTLFNLITKNISSDEGNITIAGQYKVGIIEQYVPDDSISLVDIVIAGQKEIADLYKELETCTEDMRMAEIYTRLSEIGAYEAPSKAASLLAGLGFSEEDQHRPLASFSGGYRMRVFLAKILFGEPDILLLDEPTNHLDFESIIWLEGHLAKYQGTLVIISHDRQFLNNVVNHIIHLDNLKLVSYTGNYDQFEKTRIERMMNQQALFEKQQAQKKHMMKFVDRFGAKASKAKQAQSRLKMIERMDFVDEVILDRATKFSFPDPEELPPPLITIDDAKAGYGERVILSGINLRIDADDRIALLGANGNGKSTLIKLISNKIVPLSGEIRRSSKLRIGYFAQHQTDDLNVNQTPFEFMTEIMGVNNQTKVRTLLGTFGFIREKADTKIGSLSGGEKARLLFCVMSYHSPHIMLLDEPTNHLDIEARQALIKAINEYKGAIIIVSHDPHLLESVADKLILVANGKCEEFQGDLQDYQQLVIKERKQEKQKNQSLNKDNKSDKPREDKQLAKEIAKIEEKIEILEKEKKSLLDKIENNPQDQDYVIFERISSELEDLNNKWINLNK